MTNKTPNYDRMRKGMTAKRFLRSLVIDGVIFGWILLATIDNFLEGEIFWALIDLALTILIGYFGYQNYKRAVALLDSLGWNRLWSQVVDAIEAEDNDKKEKSDGDTAV